MEKSIVVAKDKTHLKELIKAEMLLDGVQCSLNHIDVSYITDMSELFRGSPFNGNISEWETSKVTNMQGMFLESKFNGNISQWNTSQVTNMHGMFQASTFNGDISQWNTSQVTGMIGMFQASTFNGDISQWNTLRVNQIYRMFEGSKFTGDLRDWKLNDEQMQQMFGNILCTYLNVRRSIEEKEQLCATFTTLPQKSSNKKVL